MNKRILLVVFLTVFYWSLSPPALAQAKLMAGVGKADITPPIGTPLAGYGARQGKPSSGIHDRTEARALIIDTGSEKIGFVAVDHLGYDHSMVERVRSIAAKPAGLQPDRIFVMSSHTHCGGGAYLEFFPILAGRFDSKVRSLYEERAAEALIAANKNLRPARIAIGFGEAKGISRFRSSWPPAGPVDPEVGVIRVDSAETNKPMAVLFNFAAHPTVLSGRIFEFSADFVGFARNAIERLIGGEVVALFANGAQGTIAPRPAQGKDEWERAENMGTILAAEVYKAVLMSVPQDTTEMKFVRAPLSVKTHPPQRYPAGAPFPLPAMWDTEVSGFSFDNRIAFVTIPGELSSILNMEVKERGKLLGFEKTFLLGLTNDAVGYILTEDEYRHQTYESTVSFFGPGFGSFITNEVFQLLEKMRPPQTSPARIQPK